MTVEELQATILGTAIVGGLVPPIEVEEFDGPYRVVAEAMRRIWDAGGSIDLVTVVDSIESSGMLSRVGGSDVVARWCEFGGGVENLGAYCDAYLRRRRVNEMRKIAGSVVSAKTEEEVFRGVERLRSVLYGGSEWRNGRGLIGEVVRRVLPRIERQRAYTGYGYLTGMGTYDYFTGGLHRGDLVVVAARPGVGKTSLMLTWALELASRGVKVLFHSLEMSAEQLGCRVMARVSGVNLVRIRTGPLADDELAEVIKSASQINNIPLTIYDRGGIGLGEIISSIVREQPDVVMVDYLQLMRFGQAERRDVEIGEVTKGLKRIAKEHRLPVVLASQLNRAIERRSGGSGLPLLSDLRDSGSIEQDADVIVFIHRGKDDETDLIIAKHRQGPTGRIRVGWDPRTTRFYDESDGGGGDR